MIYWLDQKFAKWAGTIKILVAAAPILCNAWMYVRLKFTEDAPWMVANIKKNKETVFHFIEKNTIYCLIYNTIHFHKSLL